MTDKKLPTIDIHGKSYVMVKDRIIAFNQTYPNGCIQTEIVSAEGADNVIVRAIITPDTENGARQFVDYSQATIGQGMINTTSALENASTSAVGRALAYMGIGVLDSVASADEVHKATGAAQNGAKSLFKKPRYCVVHGQNGKPSYWGQGYPNCMNASGDTPCQTAEQAQEADASSLEQQADIDF